MLNLYNSSDLLKFVINSLNKNIFNSVIYVVNKAEDLIIIKSLKKSRIIFFIININSRK